MPTDNGGHSEDAEELFLDHFLKSLPPEQDDKKKDDAEAERREPKAPEPAEDDHDEPEEPTEDDESQSEEEEQEGDEDEDKRKYVDDEEAHVKIKVGEEEHEVPVKQLKRLFGQEAALTQKSQALAVKRKEFEENEKAYMAASHALLTQAKQRYEPYSKIDFLVLSRDPNCTAEQLQALREETQARHDEVKFLEEQTGQYMQAINQRQHEQRVATAQASVKELSNEDSPYYIEGFNADVYNGLRDFAISQGMDRAQANNVIDAPSLKLLSLAKKYVEGLSKVTTTKVNKTVKKVVKTSKTMNSSQRLGKGDDKAMAKFVKSGTVEDATDVFLSRFKELGGVE